MGVEVAHSLGQHPHTTQQQGCFHHSRGRLRIRQRRDTITTPAAGIGTATTGMTGVGMGTTPTPRTASCGCSTASKPAHRHTHGRPQRRRQATMHSVGGPTCWRWRGGVLLRGRHSGSGQDRTATDLAGVETGDGAPPGGCQALVRLSGHGTHRIGAATVPRVDAAAQ